MRTVYLAGPIAGCTDEEATAWRLEVRWRVGDSWRIADPMDRDYRGKELGNVQAIVEGDLYAISGVDAVLVNASRPSWGTAMELVYAFQWKKRIIAFGATNPSPWLIAHSTAVVPTLEEACELLTA